MNISTTANLRNHTQSEEITKAIWRNADAVSFDVDSTICEDEAIDELAEFFGVGEKVAAITNDAMGGDMTFKTSLTRRLGLIKPTRDGIMQYLEENPPRFTPGIRELVRLLHARNVPVFLVSGGFQCVIENAAEQLNIPSRNIYANRLKFYFNGDYAGFEEKQPTCEQGGKTKVMQILKNKYGFKRLVHIGDGATDLEAAPPADAFIGFGGNVVREAVLEQSSWFVNSFQELIHELKHKPNNRHQNIM